MYIFIIMIITCSDSAQADQGLVLKGVKNSPQQTGNFPGVSIQRIVVCELLVCKVPEMAAWRVCETPHVSWIIDGCIRWSLQGVPGRFLVRKAGSKQQLAWKAPHLSTFTHTLCVWCLHIAHINRHMYAHVQIHAHTRRCTHTHGTWYVSISECACDIWCNVWHNNGYEHLQWHGMLWVV